MKHRCNICGGRGYYYWPLDHNDDPQKHECERCAGTGTLASESCPSEIARRDEAALLAKGEARIPEEASNEEGR